MLEQRTPLGTETVIGVVFSASLAIGALLTTGEQLIDALFGTPGKLSPFELVAGLLGAGLVITFVRVARDRLVLSALSRDVALTCGVDVRRLDLIYLLTLSLAVTLGLRYLGVLLMGSLLIIPPAAARVLARNLTEMLVLSALIAVLSTLAGTVIAARSGHETGPTIVIVAAAIFLAASLIGSRFRSNLLPGKSHSVTTPNE
jgi:ABC-type Mn2+/Zn2+ transport system permease subunit